MYEMGVSQPKIAIIARHNNQSAQSQKRVGRPPTLSDRNKRAIFRAIEADPFIKIRDLLIATGLEVSGRTFTRWLRKDGILHQMALRRPLLTPLVARKRLEFAQRYCDQLASYWRKWIFSDESTIARGQGERQARVFCRRGRSI